MDQELPKIFDEDCLKNLLNEMGLQKDAIFVEQSAKDVGGG